MTQLHEIQVTQGDIEAQAAAITIGGIQSWSITPEGAARLKVYNDLTRLHPPGWRAPKGDLSTFAPHFSLYSDHPADLLNLLTWAEGWPDEVQRVRVINSQGVTTGSRPALVWHLKRRLDIIGPAGFADFVAAVSARYVSLSVALENENFREAFDARDLGTAIEILDEEF